VVAVEGREVESVPYRRDARSEPLDAVTGQRGRPYRGLPRAVWDVPMFGQRVAFVIEYLELVSGARYTKRLAKLMSTLCRYLPVATVSRWTGSAWRSVKDMDRDHLRVTLPALNPRDIADLAPHLATGCDLAHASGLPRLRRFAKTLQEHSVGTGS
jgi:hypothetical protein